MTEKKTTPDITPEMQAIVSIEQKRGNIEAVIDSQKDRLLRNACGYVRSMTKDNQESFLARTVTALLDDKLAECFNNPQGKLSIYRIIEDSMATGLELGKHAYAVPQSKKVGSSYVKIARYDIKRQGYHAMLCGTDKPIFKDLRWGTVYAKDTCSIDGSSGVVTHKKAIEKTRGEVIGVWVSADIVMEADKTKLESEFYPIDFIENIRDMHSESYKYAISKKTDDSPWIKDPIPMNEKTAIKSFCKPWADVKDALAHAIYEDSEPLPDRADDRPREDIADDILTAALEVPIVEGNGEQEEKEGQQPEDISDELAELDKEADGKKPDDSLF